MANLTKWSVQDYHRMIEAGILEGRPVELIDGEIVEMSPEGPIHSGNLDRAAEYLKNLLRDVAKVREAHPITLSNSEPEPDIAVVRFDRNYYSDHHPTAKDIYWIIEFSYSSLQYDLTTKADLYAAEDISEYWVVDLNSSQVIIFTQPTNEGYSSSKTNNSGKINSIAFPTIEIDLNQLLIR